MVNDICYQSIDCFADVLNGSMVLKIPLEQATGDIKMVPSLAPIWEVRLPHSCWRSWSQHVAGVIDAPTATGPV